MKEQRGQSGKWLSILAIGGAFILGTYMVVNAIIKESSRPLPGKEVADQGREHLSKDKWVKFKYNSNPPTSGPHDAVFAKSGIYDKAQEDGYLLHSLEHGYVVISYNCDEKFSIFDFPLSTSKAYAHEGEEVAEASGSALINKTWDSENCKKLIKDLSDIAKEKRVWKLVLVSRPQLDTRIALTAWRRIDKFNLSTSSGLSANDKERIKRFIDAFRDKGPEMTAN